MESSPPRSSSIAPVAGVKRPASLLPAFEPLSSSPSLPRPLKRVARDDAISTYPTPVPTSSTHIMSSSPPRMALARPSSSRTVSSAVFERTPLSAVPTLMLSENGEPIMMGRSSASCHYQLASHRMVSRIHVKATYKPAPNPFDRDRVEIMCMGWNGIKLHCQGKTYDLAKGKTFTSDIKDADIMIDVQECRVLVQWPRGERKEDVSTDSDQTWEEATPTRNKHPRRSLQDSPNADRKRLASPVSPSPVKSRIPPSSPLFTPTRSRNAVVVYEDEGSPPPHCTPGEAPNSSVSLSHSSQSSDLSELSKPEDLSDHDEENDPIIHSFGPFGDNLLPRMASFTADDSPVRPRTNVSTQPLQPTQSPRQPSKTLAEPTDQVSKPLVIDEEGERVQNHAVNQLAFSRLSSTPFSTILSNLPPSLWKANSQSRLGPSKDEIRAILDSTKSIGKVAREGKDAAGKPLEAEYYYIADFDDDPMRREAVVTDLRKPGLRNCRKQHKQYFWRKPK
ncbi:hypothetical protein BJX99DRAFT_59481 [Aspergillus californicus]